MNSRIRGWLGNIVALLCGLFFILAVLEIGLRIFVPDSNVLTVRDSYIGRRLKPNMDMMLQGEGWKSHIWTNEYGWMGHPFSVEKPVGIKRVLHIGDSFTEAIHVDTDKTFVSQLEKMFPGTEQLNLSVAGRGTLLELLTYRHYGRSYNPDLTVLWYHSGNDARDNYQTKELIHGKNIEEVRVKDDRLGYLKTFLLQYFRLPRFIFEKGKDNPYFVRVLVKTGLLSVKPEEIGEEVPLVFRTTIIKGPERDDAMKITEDLIVAMKQEVNRGKLIIGIIPASWVVEPGAEEKLIEKYPALKEYDIDLDLIGTTVKRIGAELKIPVFDATPILRAAYERGEDPYLPFDGHLNQLGHDLVAKEFQKWLIENTLQP